MPGQTEPKPDPEAPESPVTKAKDSIVVTSDDVTSPCAEVIPDVVDVDGDDPFDWVGYSQANSALTVYCR